MDAGHATPHAVTSPEAAAAPGSAALPSEPAASRAAALDARARHWLTAYPVALDVLIAGAVLAIMAVSSVTASHGPSGLAGFGERHLPGHTVVLGVLAAGALVWRRRHPLPVLLATAALTLLELVLGTSSHAAENRHATLAFAVAVALFTYVAGSCRPRARRVGLLVAAVLTAAAMLLGAQPWYVAENVGVVAWLALAGVSGEVVRGRRAVLAATRERADRAERTREEEARRRVAEERLRIARELHDVVAHHIALVNVQAGVASHVMDSRPDQAKEALAHVREASRRALSELQSTVGLLRHRDEPAAPTEPARGLAVLDELVEGFRRAGMAVSVAVPAADRPLPSAVDLAAYRVVQEALTNVYKHAGRGARAEVRIDRVASKAGGAVEVTVRDDGGGRASRGPAAARDEGAPGDAAPGDAARDEGTRGGAAPDGAVPDGPASDAAERPGTGGGHGLTGMRERAAALGGDCAVGPTDEGGFRVRVVLPLHAARGAVADPAADGADDGAGDAATRCVLPLPRREPCRPFRPARAARAERAGRADRADRVDRREGRG